MLPVREKVPHTAVRILFSKTGSLQYISHLDLHRTFTRMMVRAGVPIWYSEGFSPHPRLAFATPLSVGAESVYELLDVALAKEPGTVDTEALRSLLRGAGIPGLEIQDVYLPERPFSAITDSDYEIRVRTAGADEALAKQCEHTLRLSPLVVLKKTKKGERDVDISAQIHAASVTAADGALCIRARLAADSAGFLNPEYLVGVLRSRGLVLCGDPMKEEYSVLRIAVYCGEELFR